MIVIHIDSTPDAARLSRIYEGLDNIIVSYNRSKSNVRRLLRITGNEPVMILGHGNPMGLFNKAQNGYVIDGNAVEWLRNRPVIGIFCYASDFADRYNLHGFFTSMYISNMSEALMMQRDEGASEELIEQQDFLFCDRIRNLITSNTPMSQWPEILQSQADTSIPFVRFNYEAMTYFE